MTLPAHGTTTGVITNFISGELTQMGIKVDEELKAFNNQTITSDDGNESKEADQAWGPFTSPPEYPATKPTVVLEVGLSETADKLKNDALFWLNPKKGAANMVITCKIDRGTPFIMLEKWERPNPKGRIQVTEVVVIAQKTLTRAEKANTSIEEQMELSKTALTIPLFTLFRRDPVQGQTDIVFDEGMLKNLARRAWEEQGFLTTGS
ncbi:hypothetical protein N7478_007694 [Penicillium angulare]|uniref:uncharacterized protein n=1 Tax=Penicillium angulare TaxID=116970 RepID=UPI00253FCE59|nr:uncharacterized protein N7478_007694 [Penicillium angulare]KAJ5272569.1 hypothetical protein N7478_007694 [Penicillium angulare]